MDFATAVQRLRTIADGCQRISHLWTDCPVLVGAYAFGAVLEYPADIPVVEVVFTLDQPVEELAWGAQPLYCHSIIHLLNLHKAPVDWYWRPSGWPVANHVIHRPLQMWDATRGTDTAALDALARHTAEPLRLADPAPAERRRQLAVEQSASLAHLRQVSSDYWDRSWRQAHRGFGIAPENHLWNAVHGYLDLLTALPPETQPPETRPGHHQRSGLPDRPNSSHIRRQPLSG